MMRIAFYILLILIFPTFYFVSETIIDTSLLQLRLQLAREKLLNYELSSRVLQARFRQMMSGKDDFSNEIKMNVLESSVMNFESMDMKSIVTVQNRIGIFIVNTVRIISFKDRLGLEEDQEKTLLLQSAFLMERDRHFDKASKYYKKLEEMMKGTGDEDYGFVLLHNGYSLAIIGEADDARKKLEMVTGEFGSSHYASTARMLLALMDEGERKSDRIETRFESDTDRAVALYFSGQFALALEKFKKAGDLNLRQQYYMARSQEQTGDMGEAVKKYIVLVAQTQNRSVAVDANRRLMMIGNFYRRDEKLSKAAENNAEALGDDEALKEVQEGAALKLEPVIVEKLMERARENQGDQKQDEDDGGLDELIELQKELEETYINEELVSEETVQVLEKVVEENKKQETPPPVVVVQEEVDRPLPPLENPRILIYLVDGRQLISQKVTWDKSMVLVSSGKFSINVPESMIAQMTLTDSSGTGDPEILGKRARIEFKLKNQRLIAGYVLERYDEGYRITDNDDSEDLDSRSGIQEAVAVSGRE